MLPEWTIVGFSGHRNLLDQKIASNGIREALDQLTIRCGSLAAISSLAAGVDTIFAKDVARRGRPIFLIFPFSKSRFQQDFSSDDWKHIAPLLDKASGIEEIVIGETVEEPYKEAGALIVDRVDVVLVVWDGSHSSGLPVNRISVRDDIKFSFKIVKNKLAMKIEDSLHQNKIVTTNDRPAAKYN